MYIQRVTVNAHVKRVNWMDTEIPLQ